MRLFVDDCRSAPKGWAVARTVAEAVSALSKGGVVEVSLDYCIGEGPGETFLEVARFIAELPSARRPRRVRLHTASEAGADRMAEILRGRVDELVR